LKRLLLLAALAALGVGIAGCHDETNTPPSSQPNSPPPPAGQASSRPTPVAAPAKVVVYVINPKATGDNDMLMPREIALTHPKEPARDAVNALLDADHSPIVPGTALRGLSVDGGVATVDLSQSPINETGGESAQSAAMNALAMTLGQFPEINSYQISVKGQPIKSFGEFNADGPMDVIRPGAQLEAKGSGQ
jgi:spore germination protein GerM